MKKACIFNRQYSKKVCLKKKKGLHLSGRLTLLKKKGNDSKSVSIQVKNLPARSSISYSAAAKVFLTAEAHKVFFAGTRFQALDCTVNGFYPRQLLVLYMTCNERPTAALIERLFGGCRVGTRRKVGTRWEPRASVEQFNLKIALTMKVSKYSLYLGIILFVMCKSQDKKVFICGADCKIWILYDEKIKSSFQTGYTPFIFCFNEKHYQTYLITGTGSLKKRTAKLFVDNLLDGNTWSIFEDSLKIGSTTTHINNISEDSIILRSDAMLINIKNKFNLKNCTCDSLNAQFKGGEVDSIKTIFNYTE